MKPSIFISLIAEIEIATNDNHESKNNLLSIPVLLNYNIYIESSFLGDEGASREFGVKGFSGEK